MRRLVDEKITREKQIHEMQSTYVSRDTTLCKILDEDRETISNEIIGIHNRIDKND